MFLIANDLMTLFMEFVVIVIAVSVFFLYRGVRGIDGKRTPNLVIKSISTVSISVATLVLQLVWGRLNIVFGVADHSFSNSLRQFVLLLSMIILVYALYTQYTVGKMHFDKTRNRKVK